MTDTPRKKVVRAEQTDASGTLSGPAWTPTAEARAQATRLRIVTWVLWGLAIALQLFTIFWILKQVPVRIWLLIGAIVVTGALSITGSFLWKRANRLDPASRADTIRFFVQNQLGAIMAIITFVPLIIMVLLNKNMDGKQKTVAGIVGVVVLLVATAAGISYSSPSQEQYAEEENIIVHLTGKDEVYWVKGGSVFHVCADVPDVNRESQDGQIYQGTVAQAHAAGKDRMTERWRSEAVNHCGYTQSQVNAVDAGLQHGFSTGDAPSENDAPAEDDAPAETGDPTGASDPAQNGASTSEG